MSGNQWKEIKLIIEDVLKDFLQIYVETEGGSKSERFWGIDDVRMCIEDGNIQRIINKLKYLFVSSLASPT